MSIRKTSITAYFVAAGLANLARMPRWREYFQEETIRLNDFLFHKLQDSLVKKAIGGLTPHLFIKLMDWFYIPGMTEHFLFRKKFIENELRDAIVQGIRQVIMMGAGLDTLAVRIAGSHPHITFFEIDLPQTQQTKVHLLKEAGYGSLPNCIFKEVDLTQTKLEIALHGDNRFDPNVPTMVVLEGVLMYLSESEVKSLFATMKRLFRGRLIIVLGAIAAPDSAGNWRVRAANLFLRTKQEGTKWHCSSEAMPKFMENIGYKLSKWVSYKQLQRAYRPESEIEFVPEEDENYYVVEKRMGQRATA